jgi:integrase
MALCRYRDRDGVTRRVKAYGPSKPKAKAALDEKLERRGRRGTEVLGPEKTVAQLAEAWFLTMDKSPGTRDTYRMVLDTHILPKLGKVRLWEVSPGRVEGFLNDVRTGHTKTVETPRGTYKRKVGGPGAVPSCRTVLRLMFAMAVRHDAIPVNPVTDLIRATGPVRQARALSLEEFTRLRANVETWSNDGRMGPRRSKDLIDKVDLLIATGVRPGELLAFRWADVELRMVPPTIEVTGTVRRTSVSGLHRQGFPKSVTSARVIPLPGFAAAMLARRHLANDPEKNPLGLVFPSRAGTVIDPGNFRRQWTAARGEEFGWVTPSSFRKTVATLIERETDSVRASRQLGHSSDTVTRKHYIERSKAVPDSTDLLERFGGRLRDVYSVTDGDTG